jgi:hypothetical protein
VTIPCPLVIPFSCWIVNGASVLCLRWQGKSESILVVAHGYLVPGKRGSVQVAAPDGFPILLGTVSVLALLDSTITLYMIDSQTPQSWTIP